jgi:uncharacterized damage-inducible protein DinB
MKEKVVDDVAGLMDGYAEGAAALRAALRGAEGVDIDARPIAGKMSIREVVCHLADAEIIYAERMKRVLVEDQPTFFEADPSRFGPALFCERRPLENELAVVEAVRAHMLPILQSCDAAAFARTGNHSRDGAMTLATLLERIVRHIPHHVAFVEEKVRALAGA